MPKQLHFNTKAQRALQRGVDTVAATVRTTLGPRGRNVALEKKFGPPAITNDGITISKELDLRNPFEDMAARMLVEAANKTNDIAGDGTTTTVILAQAILREGLKLVATGVNPMYLKRGLDKGASAIIANLKTQARPVNKRDDIAHVAAISAGDSAIGEIIAEMMERVGRDGIITVEEGRGLSFETEYTEGMAIERGYVSPYFITNQERMEAELDDPLIIITDKTISAVHDILPILEQTLQARRSLVIIAENVEGEALATLVTNKMRGAASVLAVKAPSFGDHRKTTLQDIAILTSGAVISEEIGRKLESVTIADLGQARRVVANKDATTFIGGRGDEQAIKGRMDLIRVQLEATTADYDRKKLQERLASLAGGVAVLKVGAATETELKEKKHRVEDALSTARAAADEGIVAGGGIALLNAVAALEMVTTGYDDERFGVQILRRALEEPLRQLAYNAGENGAVMIANIRRQQQKQDDPNYGYNALTGEFGNLIEHGIIDPVKVTRAAVQNAVSVAGMLLTTDTLITDIVDYDPTLPQTAEQMGDF
jgi:chaperonin GroEL